MPARADRPATAEPRRSLIWLQGLACGGMVALAPETMLLMVVLLGPGLLALMLDRQPGRPVARAILLCGAAACVEPIRALWAAGHSLDAALAGLGDLGALGTAWSAAAGGWLLVELAPIATRAVLDAHSRARVARLHTLRERLAEAWGFDRPADP
jgi:hypothetical protein